MQISAWVAGASRAASAGTSPADAGHPNITDWLTAVGTCVAAIGTAFTLIWLVVEHFSKKGEALDRARRAKAEQISAWYVGETPIAGNDLRTDIALLNQSHEPVYDVVVSLVMLRGNGARDGKDVPAPFRETTGVLPPGKYWLSVAGGWHGIGRQAGVELAFVDPAGVSWLRKPDGRLEEIPNSPFDYYGIQGFNLEPPRDER